MTYNLTPLQNVSGEAALLALLRSGDGWAYLIFLLIASVMLIGLLRTQTDSEVAVFLGVLIFTILALIGAAWEFMSPVPFGLGALLTIVTGWMAYKKYSPSTA